MVAHEPMYIARHRMFVIATGWTGGVSSAPIIRSNHAETGLGKSRDYMTPFPPSLWETVKKNNRATIVARRNVVQSHARLDVGDAMSQRHRTLSLQRDHFSFVRIIRDAALLQRCRKAGSLLSSSAIAVGRGGQY